MNRFLARSIHIRGLAAAAVVGLAGGCSIFSQAPRIEIESLALVGVDDAGSEADLLVRISGGGPQATILTDFRYSVFISGRRAYSGRWAALAAAPAEESILRTLPVVIPDAMLAAFDDRTDGIEVPWSVSGSVGWEDPNRFARILLDLGFATPRAEFSGRGTTIARESGDDSDEADPGSRGAAPGFEAIDPPAAP